LSPDDLNAIRRPEASVPTSRTMPQPTPQYEHTVRTLPGAGVVMEALLAAVAVSAPVIPTPARRL
jgi:hypothetical protein